MSQISTRKPVQKCKNCSVTVDVSNIVTARGFGENNVFYGAVDQELPGLDCPRVKGDHQWYFLEQEKKDNKMDEIIKLLAAQEDRRKKALEKYQKSNRKFKNNFALNLLDEIRNKALQTVPIKQVQHVTNGIKPGSGSESQILFAVFDYISKYHVKTVCDVTAKMLHITGYCQTTAIQLKSGNQIWIRTDVALIGGRPELKKGLEEIVRVSDLKDEEFSLQWTIENAAKYPHFVSFTILESPPEVNEQQIKINNLNLSCGDTSLKDHLKLKQWVPAENISKPHRDHISEIESRSSITDLEEIMAVMLGVDMNDEENEENEENKDDEMKKINTNNNTNNNTNE